MTKEWLKRYRFLLRQSLLPGRRRSELDEELQFHLEQSILANVAAGMTAAEARRQALVEFGGVERTREQCHRQRPGWWLGTVAQDVRYALRGFRRNPVFTIAVIATLALGIGATTAVFSVVDRILFRSLPYAHADRIVSLGLVQSLEKQEFTLGGFFYEWRDNQKPFEAIASQGTMLHACDLVEANPAQLNCIHAQAGFLPLLGISPLLGRNFLPEEDRPNGPRVALISYGLWQDHYNRDPGILNRQIDVDGSPVRVIGVLPQGFELPTLQAPDVMMPLALDEGIERASSPGHPMRTFARLRPGVSIEQAKAEMEPLFLHTQAWIPREIRNDFHLSVRSLRDRETKDVQLTAWILLGAVLAVLLIACANVASLMMARGEARERELAVRSALGASRGRLVRQALTEAALLSLAGAAAGMALAEGLLRVFLAIAPTGIPFLNRAGLDLRIALFTVLLALVCGAVFGLLPALQTPRAAALAARAAKSRRRTVLRRSLVVGQIAISMVLLAGAALLLRSFNNMELQRLGIETQGVLTARIALPGFRYDTGQKKMEFYLRAEAALRRLPGIRAVAFSDSLPPGGWNNDERLGGFAPEGRRPTPSAGNGGPVVSRGVTPEYFRALNIPIVLGRNFTEEDRSSGEYWVVLSRLLAARLFPGEDPVGKRIQKGQNGIWLTVAGVAENVKNSGLTEQDEPEIYYLRRSVQQDWGGRAPVGDVMSGAAPVMIVDALLPATTVAPWVRSQIAAIDPTVPVEMDTLNQSVSQLADRPRFETALLGFFALCGLLMAVIGLYGVIAFVAAQRTQEIGVRMALGATRLDILRLIAGEGVRLILLGGALGLAAALSAAQLLKSLLYNVGPRDPAMYAAATLLLALVALAATLIPARAAMRVEPVAALRYE
jgi:predicted permease